MSIYLLNNPIIHNNWGCATSVVELFGYKNPDKKPLAEVWMGAHPKAPSKLIFNDSETELHTYINHDPVKVLGQRCSDKFNNRLPFLFKILSASSPLSIQSHPKKDQALAGWKKENSLNIPLNAPHRNYKDDNHKPELVFAVTEFHALNGFRSFSEIIDIFERVKGPILSPLVDRFSNNVTSKGLRLFYEALMTHSGKTILIAEVIRNIHMAIREQQDKRRLQAYRLVLELIESYPDDIGVLSPLLINYVILQPGDVMFINSGTLHSYLKGTALELMANSDNVLRGGLTPKHIDITELLNTTVFEPIAFNSIKIRPQIENNHNELIFHTEAEDFQFRTIKVENQDIIIPVSSAEILFVLSGEISIKRKSKKADHNNKHLIVRAGESCFISAENKYYILNGQAKVARAVTPL
ncbi:mannose-6-phosphate isomerase, class I [Marinomonas algicola]|uniref:mannose-6-phosphate isomerase, class I n=1 Tax=Marinomonas algicola TaxID=2773454 RepID=UPI00174D58BC|nr:mannose-6-phosphate isomerase, class I [Marinomonas algicola]